MTDTDVSANFKEFDADSLGPAGMVYIEKMVDGDDRGLETPV